MKKQKFVLCINNQNEDDLTLFKVYQVLIDDSGEDYLYSDSYFI